MTLTIGHIPAINEPWNWTNSGDQVTISGRGAAGSTNAASVIREQLLGYDGNPDEPVIPIVDTSDTLLSGFYENVRVDVPTSLEMFLSTGYLEWVLHAQRIPSFQSPYVESFLTGALMVNALGVTTAAEPFHAFPSAYEYGNTVTGYTIESRPTADVSPFSINWVRMNPTGAAPTYKALARYGIAATAFYQAACTITNADPFGHIVVGRQDAPQPLRWTLSNGLVTITYISDSVPFSIQWADASNTYRTTAVMRLSGATMGQVFPATNLDGANIKILRNAPEECIIRVPCIPGSGLVGTPAYLDIGLRRGSRIVRFYMTSSISDTWTFGNNSAVASTAAFTGGNVWTANDAYGNRVLIASPVATTNDLVNGKITANAAATTFACMVAMELGGNASVNRNTALSQNMQYLGGAGGSQAERMQIVGR